MTRVILVGGGNSVQEGIEKNLWEQIKEETIWSCNYAYANMPYLPSRQIWVDTSFYKHNVEDMQKLYEKGVPLHIKQHNQFAGIAEHSKQYVSSREAKNYFGRDALKRNILFYGRMGLSGMFALSLAVAEGYDEIYLLGYDFGTSAITVKKTHFYQEKMPHVYSTGVNHPEIYRMPDNKVKREVEDFKVYLNTPNLKIWNVSTISNIPYFDKLSYEDFYTKLKNEGETNG